MDNDIPFSAFEEIFKNSKKIAHFFALLHFGYSENKMNEEIKEKSMKEMLMKAEKQTEENESEKRRGLRR